jgi:hypothetical protein
VAADGTLLPDVTVPSQLPLIPLQVPPAGTHLTAGDGGAAVALLSAAPWQMLAHISQVTTVAGHGLVAQVRGGPALYFGGRDHLAAKWAAALAVLADSKSAGASYIDVSDPGRPAAGTAAPSGSSTTSGSAATPSLSTTTPSAVTATGTAPPSSSTGASTNTAGSPTTTGSSGGG